MFSGTGLGRRNGGEGRASAKPLSLSPQPAMREVVKSVDSRVPLGFLCAFLLFEYLRIHDLIPILSKTRVQTVFLGLFLIVVLRQVSQSKEPAAPQLRLFLGFVTLAFAQVPLVATNWF